MANTQLPLGLTRYGGGVFNRIHGPGSKCLTASSIADLFGLGRHGRLALAAHVMGVMPIPDKDNEMTERGQRMQKMVADWHQDETGLPTKHIHAWVKHPHMNLFASPDVVETYMPTRDRPGEIKVVAEAVYQEQWEFGPPRKHLLQHQLQMNMCGEASGPVIAARIGDYVFKRESWVVEAHAETQRIILDEAADFLAMVDAGQLPPPDLANHQDQKALVRLAKIDEGKKVDMPDELRHYVDVYKRCGKIERACEKMKDEAKAYLVDALDGAKTGVFSDKTVIKLHKIDIAERFQEAYSYNRLNTSYQKADKDDKAPKDTFDAKASLEVMLRAADAPEQVSPAQDMAAFREVFSNLGNGDDTMAAKRMADQANVGSS